MSEHVKKVLSEARSGLVGANGIPIVRAERARYFACKKGHVDVLPGPFAMALPDEHGRAVPVPLCRFCYTEWLRKTFEVAELSREEAQEYTRKAVAAVAAVGNELSETDRVMVARVLGQGWADGEEG